MLPACLWTTTALLRSGLSGRCVMVKTSVFQTKLLRFLLLHCHS